MSNEIVQREQIRTQLHPLVEAAMQSAGGLTPETLEGYRALQERYDASQAERAYTWALVRCHQELDVRLRRDATGGGGAGPRFRYTTLGALLAQIQPVLAAHGFVLTHSVENTSELVTVTAHLTHEAGHQRSTTMSAPPDQGRGRSQIQAIGSTTTYLRRYTAACLVGLASIDDDDADAPPPPTTAEDTKIRIRARGTAARLVKRGLAVSDAVALVGREVGHWTEADLDTIGDWARGRLADRTIDPETGEVLEGPPAREPGQEG